MPNKCLKEYFLETNRFFPAALPAALDALNFIMPIPRLPKEGPYNSYNNIIVAVQ